MEKGLGGRAGIHLSRTHFLAAFRGVCERSRVDYGVYFDIVMFAKNNSTGQLLIYEKREEVSWKVKFHISQRQNRQNRFRRSCIGWESFIPMLNMNWFSQPRLSCC